MPLDPVVNFIVKATDLALNRAIGIVDAPAGATHLLEMPFAPLVTNHLGTVHAAAQFALAEAASAECLQREYGALVARYSIQAIVRGVEVKYRRPATGDLLAFGRPDDDTLKNLPNDLATRTRCTAAVIIELKDRSGQTSFVGRFDWLISKLSPIS